MLGSLGLHLVAAAPGSGKKQHLNLRANSLIPKGSEGTRKSSILIIKIQKLSTSSSRAISFTTHGANTRSR